MGEVADAIEVIWSSEGKKILDILTDPQPDQVQLPLDPIYETPLDDHRHNQNTEDSPGMHS